MTEEIIIDGIKISDCAFYKDFICASPINKTCEYCKNIPENKCYYKQLQRLKQENENEKKAYNECLYYLNCMTEQRNKLKLALEEIRNDIMTNKSVCTECIKIAKRIDEVLNENQVN